MPIYPGDPLTPGVGATPGAKRLTRAEAQTVLKIPTMPISYGDARRSSPRSKGRVVTGRVARRPAASLIIGAAPTPSKSTSRSSPTGSMKTIYNVIAMHTGPAYPDQWVVRGNHHDGWVFGAADPTHRPGRADERGQGDRRCSTGAGGRSGRIVYASWDGEEPGLLGSTEWAETHAEELQEQGGHLHQHRQ